MAGTLRDRLAAVLGPGNDDTTAYAQADAVLEILALETQRQGVCGAAPAEPFEWNGIAVPIICTLTVGHTGLHQADNPFGHGDGTAYWPTTPTPDPDRRMPSLITGEPSPM